MHLAARLNPQAAAAVLGAIVGGSVAIVGGLFIQLFILWRQRTRLRKNLLSALEAEVGALISVLEQAWKLRTLAEDAQITGSYWILPRTTLHGAQMGVYTKASADLGLLPPSIVGEVFSFYGRVLALQEFVAAYSQTKDRQWSQEFHTVLVKEIGHRYWDTWTAGDKLLRNLRGRSLSWWIPGWLRPKKALDATVEGDGK